MEAIPNSCCTPLAVGPGTLPPCPAGSPRGAANQDPSSVLAQLPARAAVDNSPSCELPLAKTPGGSRSKMRPCRRRRIARNSELRKD
eukprot:5017135-Pyramimonas_sp.AAC.1